MWVRCWVLLVTIIGTLTTTWREARAQMAPPPPLSPAGDQVYSGPMLSEGQSAAVGFQGSENRFFIALRDERAGGLISTALMGTDGAAIGTSQVISSDPGLCPVVEKSVADPPVAAWSTTKELRLRVLNPDGSANGPEVVVDTSTDPEFGPTCPSLSRYVHNGVTYLLTWGNRGAVFGRILNISNPAAPFAGDAFEIASSGVASSTAIAFDYTNSNFCVVYSTPNGVFAQLVTPGGKLAGTAFTIASPSDEFAQPPVIAFSPEATQGRFLVAWEQRQPVNPGFPTLSFRSRILAQRVNLAVDATGTTTLTLTGDSLGINEPTTGAFETASPIDIAYSLALGEYILTWQSVPSTNQVSGRLLNLDGTMPRAQFDISVTAVTSVRGGSPRVAWSETFTKIQTRPDGTFVPNRMEYVTFWRGDSGDVRSRFVDPHLDSDGDGLLDDWETTGVDLNNDGQIDAVNDLNLATLEPNNPPNPLRKDVYLEIDWMDCKVGGCAAGDTHSHQLRDLNGNGIPDLVEQMTAAFANGHFPANVTNPDGSNSVTLHVDYGQLGGGNAIADDQVNIVPGNIRATGLDNLRRRIFHYAVSAHACCGGADLPGQFYWAGRGGTETDLNSVIAIASNSFMHELGHTLGLQHGGADGTNFKPNYLSVMSYGFVAGIPVVGGATPLLDFSNQLLPTVSGQCAANPTVIGCLDETALSEALGIGLPGGNQATIFSCPNGARSTQSAVGAIDWNCNASIDAGNLSVDINGDSQLTQLNGADDWSNLFYNFRVIGNFTSAAFMAGPENPNSIPPPENQPSPEEIHQSLARPDINIEFRVKRGEEHEKGSITVLIEVENEGLGLAQNVKLTAKFEGRVQTFSLGALAPSASAKRLIRFRPSHRRDRDTRIFAIVNFEDALNAPLLPISRSTKI